MHIVTRGIVLRETQYKESDKLLTVLAQGQGKATLKARGCRRKNSPLAAGSQLLVYSEMTWFSYQDRWTLQEASTLQEFRRVRQDLVRLALGSYFAEVCEAVAVEGEENQPLLSLLLNSLYAMDQLDKPLDLIQAAFDLRCMVLAGYAPLLDGCAVCGREPEEPRLNLEAGVLCCRDCQAGTGPGRIEALTGEMLAAARHIAWGDPKRLFSFRLPPDQLASFAALTAAYLSGRLEREPRTLSFYRSLARWTPRPPVAGA